MKKTLGVVAAVFLAATQALSAQQTAQITFLNGGSVDDGKYYVGNYNAIVDGSPATVNCVDFFHEVRNGDVWTVNVTSLTGGDLSSTRLGNSANALDTYKKAAFLTGQYNGASNTDVVNIQHAVWRLFGPISDPLVSNSASDAWLAFANANYDSSNFSYDDYRVLTDSRVGDSQIHDDITEQEFLTTTPEPSSLALLGTGLVGIVPMFRRRRRNS